MSPNTQNTTNLTYIKLLYKLIQCLHHITIIQQQQNGSFTKAFAQKLRSLNEFVKPANSGPQIRTKIEEINRAWVINMTNLLAEHYQQSISDLKNQIVALNLNSVTIQDLLNQTIQRAIRNFGHKLKPSTINKFKQTLFEISHTNSVSHNPTTPTNIPHNIPRSQATNTPNSHKPTNIPQNIPRSRATNQPSTNTPNSHTNSVRFAKGPHDPLSNFFPCQFRYRGMLFHSVEHAYQIQKAHFHGFHHLVNKIGACATAAQAKSVGRTIPSSGRWNSIKSNLVFEFLQLKWSQVPAFRNSLLAVQGRTILHPVPDLFWGTGDGNKTGKNIFGKLLQDTLDFQIKRRNLHTHNHTSPLSRPLTQPNQQSII